MPKLIDFFNVAELISVEKLSDMSDEKWNWRIDYVVYQCELFILESEEENKGKIAFFGGINKCKFKGQVTPGDVLEMECHLTKQKGPIGIGEAVATVDGKIACKGELTFAIV